MSIAINADLCKGCKACMAVCPGSLIKETTEGKAYMKYPKDCWGCASCVKECHFGAITFFLGADIGGMGSKLTVDSKKDRLIWNIARRDDTKEQIRKEGKRYE